MAFDYRGPQAGLPQKRIVPRHECSVGGVCNVCGYDDSPALPSERQERLGEVR